MSTQPRIITALDEQNNIIYPRTKTSAVHDEKGLSLDAILAKKANISQLGIPLYTTNQIESLDNNLLYSEYIDIGNPTLEGEPQDSTITINPQSGDYLLILFSAVRKLQAEVARLKNSFYYGLQSEIEGNTTSSNIIADTEEEEQEPLWAIDPEDLSEIEELSVEIGSNHNLTPSNNVDFYNDKNYLLINSSGASSKILLDEYYESYPKILGYFIVEPLNVNYEFNINFTDYLPIKVQDYIRSTRKFSVLFITSQRVQEVDATYNKNFYWISISDDLGNPIFLKYLKYEDSWEISNLEYNSDNIQIPSSISFKNVKLFRASYYVKEQAFSSEANTIPERDVTDDFILRPMHITIRSVSSYNLLTKIKDKLLVNELVWVEDEDESKSGLYIRRLDGLKSIGAYKGGGSNTPGGSEENPPSGGDDTPDNPTEETLWKFGDTFPIIFGKTTNNNIWKFGNSFPIIFGNLSSKK